MKPAFGLVLLTAMGITPSKSERSSEMEIHDTADVESIKSGQDTSVWQYCVILDGAEIGRKCNICAYCFIESNVIIGDNVTIKNGVYLWDGLRIGDGVFIGPNATFTNDLFPRSQQRPNEYPKTVVEDAASIGANATILAGLTIGAGAMVGAGAVVTRSVRAGEVVVGNPARHLRWIAPKC